MVMTAAGVIYDRGDVLVRGSRIAAVGASLEQSVAGRTAGPVELDDFVERHAR